MTTWTPLSNATTAWDTADGDLYVASGYILEGYLYGTGDYPSWSQLTARNTSWS